MARSRIKISAKDRELAATFYEVESRAKNPAVLMVHGFQANRGSVSKYARQLNVLGVSALTVDLAGHGDSTGNIDAISVTDNLKEVTAAYDTLATMPSINPNRMGVMGMSYGGYLAVLLTENRHPKSLLLRAAPAYPNRLRDLPRSQYEEIEALRPPDSDNSAIRDTAAYTGSLTLVSSEFDQTVPNETTDAYLRVRPDANHYVLHGVGHAITPEVQDQFTAYVQAWAQELKA